MSISRAGSIHTLRLSSHIVVRPRHSDPRLLRRHSRLGSLSRRNLRHRMSLHHLAEYSVHRRCRSINHTPRLTSTACRGLRNLPSTQRHPTLPLEEASRTSLQGTYPRTPASRHRRLRFVRKDRLGNPRLFHTALQTLRSPMNPCLQRRHPLASHRLSHRSRYRPPLRSLHRLSTLWPLSLGPVPKASRRHRR